MAIMASELPKSVTSRFRSAKLCRLLHACIILHKRHELIGSKQHCGFRKCRLGNLREVARIHKTQPVHERMVYEMGDTRELRDTFRAELRGKVRAPTYHQLLSLIVGVPRRRLLVREHVHLVAPKPSTCGGDNLQQRVQNIGRYIYSQRRVTGRQARTR